MEVGYNDFRRSDLEAIRIEIRKQRREDMDKFVKEAIESIRNNICESECVDDERNVNEYGEEMQLHSYLSDKDFADLCNSIKKNKDYNSFCKTLIEMMDARGMTSPMLYKAASMDRRDFSRLMDFSKKSVPKRLIWHATIGLKCSMQEADELLASAGYVRRQTALDLTMVYFIERRNYDVMAINQVLAEFGEKIFTVYIPTKDSDVF